MSGPLKDPDYFRSITVERVKETILAHVPSLTDKAEEAINEKVALLVAESFGYTHAAAEIDTADLAIRECACGVLVDGYYQYVDHLLAVFGGESHIGG